MENTRMQEVVRTINQVLLHSATIDDIEEEEEKERKMLEAPEEKIEVQDTKAQFVLVHGLGSGAWCWYKVATLLKKGGYTVRSLDLRSSGIDPTDVNLIHTFEDYNKPLVDLFSALPENEKVVLVGHSAGGLSVTDIIHRCGGKIKVAVFVAATMLRRGFLTTEDFDIGVPRSLKPPPANRTGESAQHVTPAEDETLAALLEKPPPSKAILRAKFPDTPGIDEVKRVYIKTSRDQVLVPAQQEAMVQKWPPAERFVLDSDHNANFTTPKELVDILSKLAESN